jgi:hypothetical protein
MNQHLLIRASSYAEFRRRQLHHHNLWSMDEWCFAIRNAGFEEIDVVHYLPGVHCQFWDRIDVIGDLGIRRYRVATAVRKMGSLVLPRRAKLWVKDRVTAGIRRQLEMTHSGDAEMCAALLIATKSGATTSN